MGQPTGCVGVCRSREAREKVKPELWIGARNHYEYGTLRPSLITGEGSNGGSRLKRNIASLSEA